MSRISIYDARRVKRSLKGRIDRLRRTRSGRFNYGKSPINSAELHGIFESEIQRAENAYGRMLARVDSALNNVMVEI